MKCYNCGNAFVEHIGTLEMPSTIVGIFSVNNANYYKCDHCDEILLSNTTWTLVDQTENDIIINLLKNLPFNKFIGATKAAEILNISRQALHKHRRIRRGFVYSIKHEGKIYYHIDSVKLYKENGDGRFSLTKEKAKTDVEYIFITIPYSSDGDSFRDYGSREEITSWNPSQNTLPTSEGHYYEQ